MYPYNADRQNGHYNTNFQSNSQNIYMRSTQTARPDKKLLDMVITAIEDEEKDAAYYREFMNITRDAGEKEILRGLYADEVKHKKYLQDIYTFLTGKKAPEVTPEKKMPSLNIKKNYENAIFDELEAVDFYRQIFNAVLNLEIRDLMAEIIADEQNHAIKLNFLYAKK